MKAIFIGRYLTTENFCISLSAASERAHSFVCDRLPAIFPNCQDHAIKTLPYEKKIIFKVQHFVASKALTWWRHDKAIKTSLDQLFYLAWVDFNCPNEFGFESLNSTNLHDFELKNVYQYIPLIGEPPKLRFFGGLEKHFPKVSLTWISGCCLFGHRIGVPKSFKTIR